MWREFLIAIACSILCTVAIFDHLGPLSNGPCINSFGWEQGTKYIRLVTSHAQYQEQRKKLSIFLPQSCGLEKSKGLNWAI
jgi:hypothetical protein